MRGINKKINIIDNKNQIFIFISEKSIIFINLLIKNQYYYGN
jgi:hypothetical protein